MTTDKSTIVSAQYTFASTFKDGIHVLQEPVPEVIELVAQAPLVKDFTLIYDGTDNLLMTDIFWTFVGTGNISAGNVFVTHIDALTNARQTVQLAHLNNITSQGYVIQLDRVMHTGDQIEFLRTNSFDTEDSDNFVTIACRRCLLVTVPLRVV